MMKVDDAGLDEIEGRRYWLKGMKWSRYWSKWRKKGKDKIKDKGSKLRKQAEIKKYNKDEKEKAYKAEMEEKAKIMNKMNKIIRFTEYFSKVCSTPKAGISSFAISHSGGVRFPQRGFLPSSLSSSYYFSVGLIRSAIAKRVGPNKTSFQWIK